MHVQTPVNKNSIPKSLAINKVTNYFQRLSHFFKDGIFPYTWEVLSRSRRYWLKARKVGSLFRTPSENFLVKLRKFADIEFPKIELSCARIVSLIKLGKSSAASVLQVDKKFKLVLS